MAVCIIVTVHAIYWFEIDISEFQVRVICHVHHVHNTAYSAMLQQQTVT